MIFYILILKYVQHQNPILLNIYLLYVANVIKKPSFANICCYGNVSLPEHRR